MNKISNRNMIARVMGDNIVKDGVELSLYG